jgi:hypothetical protein
MDIFQQVDGDSKTAKRLCSNPLHRLCDKLSDFNIVDVLVERATERDGEPAKTSSKPPSLATPLPITFPSFRDYVLAWEPLLLDEIRENTLSTVVGKLPTRGFAEGSLRFSVANVMPLVKTVVVDVTYQPLPSMVRGKLMLDPSKYVFSCALCAVGFSDY